MAAPILPLVDAPGAAPQPEKRFLTSWDANLIKLEVWQLGQSEWVGWLQKQKQAWEVEDQDLEAHYDTTEFEDVKEWLQGDRERRMAEITADRDAKKAAKRA